MKIKLISDIHTEFDSDRGEKFLKSVPNEGVDVLVVAGDLTTKYYEENLSLLCDRFPDVIYVMGNHDYWHSSIQERHAMMGELSSRFPNLHWLHNQRVNIGGVNFAGCPLWFPRKDCPITKRWPDFAYVAEGHEGIFQEHETSRKFLEDEVQAGDVVITHHLPTQDCVADEWKGSRSNCYFVANVEDVVYGKEPAYWFFGHTHNARHLMVGKTEFFCNPRGYPMEGVAYDPELILDTGLDEVK
jgi:Icc-related predicted phosphoesterase